MWRAPLPFGPSKVGLDSWIISSSLQEWWFLQCSWKNERNFKMWKKWHFLYSIFEMSLQECKILLSFFCCKSWGTNLADVEVWSSWLQGHSMFLLASYLWHHDFDDDTITRLLHSVNVKNIISDLKNI